MVLKKPWQVVSASGEFRSNKGFWNLFAKAMSLHMTLQKFHRLTGIPAQTKQNLVM